MIQKEPTRRDTQQINIRIPSELLNDLDKISKILRVNKSEWIKIKLGEIIYQEKSKLIERYVELSKNGLIDKKEIEKLMK
jgi:hypothetical protein